MKRMADAPEWPAGTLGVNPQLVLVEGAAIGFMLVTVILNRKR